MPVNIKRINRKVIACLLVIMLTITNFLLLIQGTVEAVTVDMGRTTNAGSSAEENTEVVSESSVENSTKETSESSAEKNIEEIIVSSPIKISNKIEKFAKIYGSGVVILQDKLEIKVETDKELSDGVITINVPKLAEKLPQSIQMIMTDVGYAWTYKNGVLSITPDEMKSNLTYKIIYVYDESVWNPEVSSEQITWSTAYEVKIDGNALNEEKQEEITASHGGAVSKVKITTSDIYNGKMLKKTGKVETEYTESWETELSYLPKNQTEDVTFETLKPKYIFSSEEIEPKDVEEYYISSKIGTNALKSWVGDVENVKSKLEVFAINKDGTETEVTVNNPIEGSQYLTMTYPENTVNVKISIKDVESNATTLKISHDKKMVTDTENVDVENLTIIKHKVRVNYLGGNYENTKEIKIKNAENKATISLNNVTELSAQNNNTSNDTIGLIVKLMSEDEASQKLFKNPTFKITLPKGVTAKEITSVDLNAISKTELDIKEYKIENNQIIVELAGTQTNYVAKGRNPQININVKIEVSKEQANRDDKILLEYYSEDESVKTAESENIRVKSSNDNMIFTITKVEVDGKILDASNRTINEQIEISNAEKVVKVTNFVINNTSTKIKNAGIDVKAKKNTSVIFEESVSDTEIEAYSISKFEKDIKIPAGLTYNEAINITVEAFKNNGQTANDKIATSVINLTTPELNGSNLFDGKLNVDTIIEKGDGTVVDENTPVYEGETLTYKIVLNNLSNEDINGLNITATQTNGNVYGLKAHDCEDGDGNPLVEHTYEELETSKTTFEPVNISANGSKELTYRVVVNRKDGNVTKGTLKFNLNEYEEQEKTTQELNVRDAKIKTIISINRSEENTSIYTKAVFPINVAIQNLTQNDIQNVKVKIHTENLELKENSTIGLSSELEYKDIKNENDCIEFTIVNLPAEYNKIVRVTPFVKQIPLNESNTSVSAHAKVYFSENEIYATNKIERTVKQSETELKIVQSSNIVDTNVLEDGKEIIIKAEITNLGRINANGITVSDEFPNGFEVKSVKINDEDRTNDLNGMTNKLTSLINIEAGKTATIIVNITLNTDFATQKEVKNVVEMDFNGKEYSSNELTFKIDAYTVENIAEEEGITNPDGTNNPSNPEDTDNPQDPENDEQVKKYTIEGNVWLDLDEDGKMTDEIKLNGITIRLIDANNKNSFVTDKDGNDLTVTTDSEGRYKFTGIEEGQYSVVFMYDTNKFEIANNSSSTDYILSDTKVAISETIDLNENKTDINLGLVDRKDFDLRLDTYITKVTTQTTKETKVDTYENKQLARVEIPSKYISGASVIVEYTIRITNNGELPGYVTELQDKLPDGMKFSSELNTEWYSDMDGNLYNTGLSNIVINPGESKDVKLILIKNMTTENTGTTTNIAKIATTSNAKGYQDIDLENDESKADLMITPATGRIVTYAAVVVGSIMIVLIGVVIIKRKILS